MGRPEAEPRLGASPAHSIVVGCVIVAVAPMGFLHVAGSTAIDPFGQTLSDYVVVPGGYALLGTGAIALAVAGLVVAAGLFRAGLPRPGLPAGLMVSWSAALVLVAVFPTNVPGAPPDLSAAVHRYAAAWVSAVLPLIGWLAARRARAAAGWAESATTLVRWSGAAGLLSCAFLVAHLPVIAGAQPHPLLGGVERVLYAVLGVMLVATARAARLAADHAAALVAARPVGVGIGEAA